MNRRRTAGFTLIEILVAVSLVALMSTLALPFQELAVKRNQEADLRAALRQIREALDAYKLATENGNIMVSPLDSGYPKTLAVLVAGVADAKSPNGRPLYFLRRIPRDPFAAPALKAEEGWGLRSYLSPHDAPRPGDDVYDVYSLSPGTGLNGIAYREW